jgi:putative phosphoribosyl transferase
MIIYRDRRQAGKRLAELLMGYKAQPNTLILALPRGGVPIGYELAQALKLPLDIFLVRKLGVPGQEELAMGAIAIGDHYVFNQEIIHALQIPQFIIHQTIDKQKQIIAERNQIYRSNRPAPELKGKTIILVDDGLATGATMRVAVAAIQQQESEKIIVAVPVAAPETCQQLAKEVDEVVCLQTPEPFYGVGRWYENFNQTTDAEVIDLLKHALLPH